MKKQFAVFDSSKSRFVKKQARRLLSKLVVKTPLSKVPILVIFCFRDMKWIK